MSALYIVMQNTLVNGLSPAFLMFSRVGWYETLSLENVGTKKICAKQN